MLSVECFPLLISALIILSFGQPQAKFFRSDYSEYIPEADSFYKIHTIHKTWEQAKENCELEGAELFYPENEDEAKAVIAYWGKTQSYQWIYIGVSASYAPEVFVTIDGIPISNVYDRWGPGEPNNAGGEEGCVILRRDATLNDEKCDKKFPYICKKRASTIDWNTKCDLPDIKYEYKDQLGRCYKFHTTPMSWSDAIRVCHVEQSYLAIIDSQAEADHLVNITQFAKKDDVEESYSKGSVHLGFVKKNSRWQSIKGRPLRSLGYTQWDSNQPDGGDKENCGSMFYNGKLNDIGCSQKCFFICEREIPLLESAIEPRFGDQSNVERS